LIQEVLEELISFLEDGNFYKLFFSFNPIKFIPSVSFNIPKVFQGDVSLLGILLSIIFDFTRIIGKDGSVTYRLQNKLRIYNCKYCGF